jgi:hypothetical protein
MRKKRRVYQPRIVGDKVMMPADLKRLHKYMLDIEHIDHISDEMRTVVDRNGRSSSISCRRSRSTNLILAECPLSGAKRTWPKDGVRSAYDPERS